jgi:hypothetical protein
LLSLQRHWWPRSSLALLVVARASAAHNVDVVAVELVERENTMTEIIMVSSETLMRLAPVDSDGDGLLTQGELDERVASISQGLWRDVPMRAQEVLCEVHPLTQVIDGETVVLQASFSCPAGALTQDFKVLRILPANYRVVMSSMPQGQRVSQVAQGSFSVLHIPRASSSVPELRHRPPTLMAAVAMAIALASILTRRWFQTRKQN